ncbi:hypothetical protein ACFXEL_15205 [Streptomyces sp. NPDC059382]|uniref:hypothetical protein n=1 Tax=Streptomyces sp. NPDC059382 TaxID=3346816 RepID=UPI0036CB531F
MKEQVVEKAARMTDQIRETAEQAARLMKDKTPDPVLDRAAQASRQVAQATTHVGRLAADKTPESVLDTAGQVATRARANRTPLLALGALLAVYALVRRSRGRK